MTFDVENEHNRQRLALTVIDHIQLNDDKDNYEQSDCDADQ